jgi:hypothetical protein
MRFLTLLTGSRQRDRDAYVSQYTLNSRHREIGAVEHELAHCNRPYGDLSD